ncbi:hypothetical protein LWI29_006413 [Acer saccharum]|uniref:Uncharacterized protein n=1 Tax=Acer saccharum TaxID=4024 RepID=A0AA39SJE7_ACESA|nr:hypothetical protein LWI29_006413 [Acer saccharum]
MKTRNSSRLNDETTEGGSSDKSWNLEVEITKVIEKGAALGVNFRNLREENEAGWSVPDEEEEIERLRAEWNLEEEITKREFRRKVGCAWASFGHFFALVGHLVGSKT